MRSEWIHLLDLLIRINSTVRPYRGFSSFRDSLCFHLLPLIIKAFHADHVFR
jgi:hypothetical protein